MILTVAELFNKLCESEYFAGVLTGFKGPIRLEMPKVPVNAQSGDGADRLRAAEFLETWARHLRDTVTGAGTVQNHRQMQKDLQALCSTLGREHASNSWVIDDTSARAADINVPVIIGRNS